MALCEKRIEGFSQTIIIELFCRDIPQELSARFRSPLANVDQRERVIHPSGDEHRENGPVVVFGLRVGREMLVDDLCHVHAIEQRRDHSERPYVTTFDGRVGLISVPCCCTHMRNLANLRKASNPSFGKISSSGI